VIVDDDTYQLAADFRRQQTKKLIDFVESLLRPNISRLHAAHKDALDDLKLLQRDALAADQDLKRRMEQYQLAERRRKEEERLARERAIAEERARLLAEELAFASEVEDDKGSLEILEEMAAPPTPVSLPAVVSAIKAEGAVARFRQRFRVLDMAKIKGPYLKVVVDEEKIQAVIDKLGRGAEEEVGVGGIEWYEEAIVGSRR
jgi:superfamily I DNA and/or RNA helicase